MFNKSSGSTYGGWSMMWLGGVRSFYDYVSCSWKCYYELKTSPLELPGERHFILQIGLVSTHFALSTQKWGNFRPSVLNVRCPQQFITTSSFVNKEHASSGVGKNSVHSSQFAFDREPSYYASRKLRGSEFMNLLRH